MLMLLFVVLQVAKSQTITTLAPQSNCPSNIYFDYIANAKIQQQQLIVSGELVGTADSILQIVFTLENPSNTIKISSNDIISFFIEKVKWQHFFYSNKTKKSVELKPNNFKIIEKNEVIVYINLSEKLASSTIKKNVELILVCTAIYKNGCKYIKKQKISFEN